MSTLDINLVSAGGDGLIRSVEKPPPKRTPIPSSRKLTTRPQLKNENVKRKLEEALHQLSAKPREYNRKRAQTMAEITPSKRKASRETKLPEMGSETKSAPRKEDASRRVYQQLLLNAWRRRRVQVATLTDSCRRLQSQVDQLQIQVNVLQKLRESESQKRLESANETERLRQGKTSLEYMTEKLRKEGETMRTKISNLENRLEETNVYTVNIKNELVMTKGELSSYEIKLHKEHNDNEMLEIEKQELLDKMQEYKKVSVDQLETIQRLQADLDNAEQNLDTAILEKSELEIKLENEIDIKHTLEEEFIKAKVREERLERRSCELKRRVNVLNETEKHVMQDNLALKRTLEELAVALNDEKSKTWWKNMAKTVLTSLHNAAYVMLPAYPKEVDICCSHEEVKKR